MKVTGPQERRYAVVPKIVSVKSRYFEWEIMFQILFVRVSNFLCADLGKPLTWREARISE